MHERLAFILVSFATITAGCHEPTAPQKPGIELLDVSRIEASIDTQQMRFRLRPGRGLELEFSQDASDPFVSFAHRFDSDTVDRIEVEAEGLPNEDLHIYWASRTSCRSMSENCKIALRPSGPAGTWVAITGEHSWWRGQITQLRIDFNLPGGPPFALRSIRLISDGTADAPSRHAGLAQLGEAQLVATNMFNLEMRKVFELDLDKKGGGIGATASELIVVAGDGHVRIVDLETFNVSKPALELPENNEAKALEHAKRLPPESFGTLAADQVQARLRYDDILVFDDARERHMIISYGHFDPAATCFDHRVSRLSVPLMTRLADTTALEKDWTLLFASKPCFDIKRGGNVFAGHQSGGRLARPDAELGRILFALGDYEFDGMKDVPSYPQDMSADYGKVIGIDIATGSTDIVSIGHRNPQGIAVDRHGTTWSAEHGPQGGDELNRIEHGANYGWPEVTQGIMYGREPWPFNPTQGRHEGYRRPTFGWIPSIGISNLDESTGFHPLWEGDLLIFTLKDHSILRLRIHEERVLFSEQITIPGNEPIRYGLNHAASGSLYLWTDEGALYRVTPAEEAWSFLEESEALYRESRP